MSVTVCPIRIMRALNDAVNSVQGRYVEASWVAAWEFQILQNLADEHGCYTFITIR
jgi:hypothetical protein